MLAALPPSGLHYNIAGSNDAQGTVIAWAVWRTCAHLSFRGIRLPSLPLIGHNARPILIAARAPQLSQDVQPPGACADWLGAACDAALDAGWGLGEQLAVLDKGLPGIRSILQVYITASAPGNRILFTISYLRGLQIACQGQAHGSPFCNGFFPGQWVKHWA